LMSSTQGLADSFDFFKRRESAWFSRHRPVVVDQHPEAFLSKRARGPRALPVLLIRFRHAVRRSAWSLSRVLGFSIGQPPDESAGQRNIQGREGSHVLPERASTAAQATADGPGRFTASTSRLKAYILSAPPASRLPPTALRHYLRSNRITPSADRYPISGCGLLVRMLSTSRAVRGQPCPAHSIMRVGVHSRYC